MCVSLFALPGDRSSSGTELRVLKTVLSSLVPTTSLPSMFYSAFSLGIPRSFDAHVSLERVLSIWHSTPLSLYLRTVFTYFESVFLVRIIIIKISS